MDNHCNTGSDNRLDGYLQAFKQLLNSIKGENVVIAGTLALKAHGLKMSRETNDMDVVIYFPTHQQLQVLENLQCLAIGKNAGDYPVESTRVLKFKKDGFNLDLLIEHAETPPNLLYYKYGGEMFKIQDIAYNMEAKNSFKTKEGQPRVKDLLDAIDLKQQNFNVL